MEISGHKNTCEYLNKLWTATGYTDKKGNPQTPNASKKGLKHIFNVLNRSNKDKKGRPWDRGLILRQYAHFINWQYQIGLAGWQVNVYMDAKFEDPFHNQCLCTSPFCYNVMTPPDPLAKGGDIGGAYGLADAPFKRCYTCGQRTHWDSRGTSRVLMLLSAGVKAGQNEPLVHGAWAGIKKVMERCQVLEHANNYPLAISLGGPLTFEVLRHPDMPNVEIYTEKKRKRKVTRSTSTFTV